MFEHIVGHFLVRGATVVDKDFQKSLNRAIPGLAELLAAPKTVLARSHVRIGPLRFYGSAAVLALIVAFWVWVGLLVADGYKADKKDPKRAATDAALICLIGYIPLVFFLRCFYRGGSCTITKGGVEMTYRGKTVFCPWALFDAVGQPTSPVGGQSVVPINPAAVPLIEVRKVTGARDASCLSEPSYEILARGGAVTVPHLELVALGTAIQLMDLYEVDIQNLAELLLRLGRSFRNVPPTV